MNGDWGEPPALELRELAAGYGRIEVLHGIDVVAPRGSVIALLGLNGAGKTTTLSAIAGLIPLMRGEVYLHGCPISGLSAYERTRSGIVLIPEGRSVFPSLTVRENLDLVARAADCHDAEREARMAEVLDTFPRLGERLSQAAGTLSGGEQQMLAMSRAFLSTADVLLMDEISMGLAPQLVESLFDAVARLRAQGKTIVLVEQFLTYALRFADICYVLTKGGISFIGDAGELRSGAAGELLHMGDAAALT